VVLNGRTPSTGCRIPQGQATGWRPPHPRGSPAIFPVSLKVTHRVNPANPIAHPAYCPTRLGCILIRKVKSGTLVAGRPALL
jgi:hypothetical protein